MAFGNPKQLIIWRGNTLSPEQIDQALAVSSTTPWYVALVQLIDESRQEFGRTAPTWADKDNALAMARDAGAYEALSGLLIELEQRRAKNAE